MFFLKCKQLSDARVASIITKKEYGFSVHFLKIFMKSLKSISDELWDESNIFWHSKIRLCNKKEKCLIFFL